MKRLVLGICFGLSVLSSSAFANECGDVNGDGQVNNRDALKALRHANGLEVLRCESLRVADVNSDGKVDKTDIELIQKKALRLPVDLKCQGRPRRCSDRELFGPM